MDRSIMLNELMEERDRLVSIMNEARRRFDAAPEGSVRVSRHGKGYQYYHITERGDTTGSYIPAADVGTVKALMQKRYDRQVAAAAREQAAALDRAGVPYRYECPLRLGGLHLHPDFTLLRIADRKELYWEHLGLADDEEYMNTALLRVRTYEQCGIFPGEDLIVTMETGAQPFNATVIEHMIRHYFNA